MLTDTITTLRQRVLALKGLQTLGAVALAVGVSRNTLDAFLRHKEPVSRLTLEKLEAWVELQGGKA